MSLQDSITVKSDAKGIVATKSRRLEMIGRRT